MTQTARRKLVPELNGAPARWYARLRGSEQQLGEYRRQAGRLAAGLPPGAPVLEVACGPGYLAVELARLGLRTTAVDLAPTFVQLTTQLAAELRLAVEVRQGDVAALPLPAEQFDLVVCQAAFKNFRQPVRALDEFYRVLRPGGTAIVQDLRREVSTAELDQEVRTLQARGLGAFVVRGILAGLRRRAYPAEELLELARRSRFAGGELQAEGISYELRLRRPPGPGDG
jgi:ubiquinone/menaquinone biosynthesis C-methylase UbiE